MIFQVKDITKIPEELFCKPLSWNNGGKEIYYIDNIGLIHVLNKNLLLYFLAKIKDDIPLFLYCPSLGVDNYHGQGRVYLKLVKVEYVNN